MQSQNHWQLFYPHSFLHWKINLKIEITTNLIKKKKINQQKSNKNIKYLSFLITATVIALKFIIAAKCLSV